ncbi:UNVERIFIED_CONTAM: hypothetical protein FKN15_076026 [Acipenser sinensis]
MPNCYLYPGSPLQPPGDSGNGGWNTRPPKCVPANPSFFALRIHSEATRPIVPEDNTDLMAPLQNCRRPNGHRGRWCTLNRRFRDLRPPYPGGTRPIVRRPLGTPVTVGSDISWIRTCDLQAIGRILQSSRSAFTGCATREPI